MGFHVVIRAGRFVRVEAPGEAHGSHDLRRRGQRIGYDPTCWPRSKSIAYALTTGKEPFLIADAVTAGHVKLLAEIFAPEISTNFNPAKNAQDAEAWEWILRWRQEARAKTAQKGHR